RSYVAIAGLAHSLFTLRLPALEGRRRKPGQRAYFLAVAKLAPAEELHRVQPGAVRADPAQRVQLPHLLQHRIRNPAQLLAALRRQAIDQPVVEQRPPPLPREARLQTFWQCRSIPLPQGGELRERKKAATKAARVSLFAAREAPDAISRLVLWWISGGLLSMMRLGSYYCCEPAEEASLRGIEGGARMPILAQKPARKPRNREIMLKQDRDAFITQMDRWARGYVPSPDSPVGGLTKDDFARMKMPVMILRGSPRDLYHPAWVCEQVHELLPNSRLAAAPWPIDVFAERTAAGPGLFCDWPLLVPQIAAFMHR